MQPLQCVPADLANSPLCSPGCCLLSIRMQNSYAPSRSYLAALRPPFLSGDMHTCASSLGSSLVSMAIIGLTPATSRQVCRRKQGAHLALPADLFRTAKPSSASCTCMSSNGSIHHQASNLTSTRMHATISMFTLICPGNECHCCGGSCTVSGATCACILCNATRPEP